METSSISRWFEYESGHAWCESAYKYQTLPYVAEFANTCTNLPIIVLPLVNIMLLRRYLQDVNGGLIFPQLLLTFNGLASTYYHATLNLTLVRWTVLIATAILSGLCFLEPNL
ncbi:hypothetical protein CAEBREN_32540 [Caenorhabditis brenneri]|uniref:Alkaline ceramidase n=1 Tax=Caenorhabditis brenneri TaxID=135651 RepID=G0PLZ2_CAEBE|nr:hypothetical protein CAEBREN_32540 [Caenorhabditis brenneri]